MKTKDSILDFGTIKTDSDLFGNTCIKKKIIMTVYSNSEWILLAKPNSSDSIFNSFFTDETSPISYSVKTENLHTSNEFYPFIRDEYSIIASGKETSQKGQKIEIELRLNGNIESVDQKTSIDFVLLTKNRYEQKMKRENECLLPKKEIVAT